MERDDSRTKKSVSFRFSPRTIAHLKQRTKLTRDAQTELAERYINEGLRHDEHPLVYFRDGASGRRPALLGTRLDLGDVITTIRQNDNSIEEAADYLEVPVEQVAAAARYYAEYQDEIDELIERSQALAERERELRRRQQEALA